MKYWLLFLGFFLPSIVTAAPDDFDSAKRLARKIYPSQSQTWYCGCSFRWQGDKAHIDLASCGYKVRKNVQRAQRLEWEHVVPAQQFGHQRSCWKQGGRDLCSKKDSYFKQMEGDLYNLRPSIGEVNGDRAHYRFAELGQATGQYGACPVQIDPRRELVEPRDSIKGDTARIYFYMMDRYQIPVTSAEMSLFKLWHQQDPVDNAERQLNAEIARYMGWPNPFVNGDKQPQGLSPLNDNGRPALVATESVGASNAGLSIQQHAEPALQKVLGNKNSKKYHLSHCPGYQQVSSSNQVWFVSEQEASDAGFVRAGNCKAKP